MFLRCDERNGITAAAGPGCATNPMYVVFRCIRQLKIYDVADAFNIKAAGSDIRRDENVKLSVSEMCQCSHPSALTLTAVNGRGRVAGFFQYLGQLVRSGFSASKHQSSMHVSVL